MTRPARTRLGRPLTPPLTRAGSLLRLVVPSGRPNESIRRWPHGGKRAAAWLIGAKGKVDRSHKSTESTNRDDGHAPTSPHEEDWAVRFFERRLSLLLRRARTSSTRTLTPRRRSLDHRPLSDRIPIHMDRERRTTSTTNHTLGQKEDENAAATRASVPLSSSPSSFFSAPIPIPSFLYLFDPALLPIPTPYARLLLPSAGSYYHNKPQPTHHLSTHTAFPT